MSHAQQASPDAEYETETTDDRGRRRYHPRPVPRRRANLMGFNTFWWVLLWLIVIALAVFPFPLWW